MLKHHVEQCQNDAASLTVSINYFQYKRT